MLTETYFNKVNIQITQQDDFIQTCIGCLMMYSEQRTRLLGVCK